MNLAPRSTAMSTLVVDLMPPSIELPARDLDRPVDHRQRGRGRDRLRDRHVVPARRPEHDPLTRVEVGRDQVQLGLEQPEVVGAVALVEHLADVVLDPGAGVEPGWQRLRQPGQHVHQRDLAPAAGEAARQTRQAERHQQGAGGEVGVVGAQQGAQVHVAEGRRHLAVDDPRHLLRSDARGQQARHEGSGARPDVDVELVDRPVDAQQVERPQCPDLVDAAGEAAAAQHERRLGPTAAAPLRLLDRAPLRAGAARRRTLEFDDVAHGEGLYTREPLNRPQTGRSVSGPASSRRYASPHRRRCRRSPTGGHFDHARIAHRTG